MGPRRHVRLASAAGALELYTLIAPLSGVRMRYSMTAAWAAPRIGGIPPLVELASRR